MTARVADFRDIFARDALRETLRAFLIFVVLVLALVAIGGQLAFRGLSLGVLSERLNLGRRTAQAIAEEITRLSGQPGGVDYRTLRENREHLHRMIHRRIERVSFIRSVEVRDRYGVRIIYVPREGATPSDEPRHRSLTRRDAKNQRIIRVPLPSRASGASGLVLLAISPPAVEQELLELQRWLWIKIGVAGLLAVGVLVLGLFYVLHLLRKNRNLERARQSAERASYVGVLASGLAHEIRNPLNAMNMNVQMLEEELQASPGSVDAEHAELLESTKNEIKRLEQLVNNFLTYARPARPRLEPTDLNALIKEVTRLLEADFRQNGVDLVEDLEPLLPNVETDATQFKQALINLLVNARQILKSGGQVSVRTRAGSKGEVVLEVRDDGPGIPEEAQERIFEVFFSSRGGGTGLGLPIAKQIVERHGGTIEVDSVTGEGAAFRIRLPRHHEQAIRPEAPKERPA